MTGDYFLRFAAYLLFAVLGAVACYVWLRLAGRVRPRSTAVRRKRGLPMSSTSHEPYPVGATAMAGGDQCRCGRPRREHYRWGEAVGIGDHEFALTSDQEPS